MTKHLKLNVKNTQIAGAINLGGLKAKLAKQKGDEAPVEKELKEKQPVEKKKSAPKAKAEVAEPQEKKKRLVAKPKSEEAPVEQVAKEEQIKEAPPSPPPVVEVKKEEVTPPVEAAEPEAPSLKNIIGTVRQPGEKTPPSKWSEQQPSSGSFRSTSGFRAQPMASKPYETKAAPASKPQPHDTQRKPGESFIRPMPTQKEESGPRPGPRQGDGRFHERPPFPRDRDGQPPRGGFGPPREGMPPRRDGFGPPRHAGPRQDFRPSGPRSDFRPSGPRQDFRPSGPRSDFRPSGPRQDFRPSGPRPGGPRQDFRPGGPRPMGPRPGGGSFPPKVMPPLKEDHYGDEAKRHRADYEELRSQKGKVKEQTLTKPIRKEEKTFDARTRRGLISEEDEAGGWRSAKRKQKSFIQDVQEVRPSKIKVRLPISIKDLAVEMKLKSSELIGKLFLQGMVVTLNDILNDATVVGLLGHEFGCEVTIDTTEESRIRISDKNVREEIAADVAENLQVRSPVVAFMGHVDHGKTSLIDAIRKSNRAAKEAGAITQHIGAFKCKTSHGDITILDTPGHEAFTLMRERGAEITDIVVLVIAGDEGIKEQTLEVLKQAREANATIVVALTKADKPNFNAENVYRQMADQELLPEIWGGQVITISCSSVTGQGIPELLEMLALQAEVLELRANPKTRARGSVIESQMQQGLGAVATVLVQNGTLHPGDALVFGSEWAKVKTMRDEHGADLRVAPPSTPVQITGLSGLPEAGEEFIVVKNEKEAREIAEVRQEGKRQSGFQLKKRSTVENLMERASKVTKKIYTIILRADVQGSLEAVTKALEKIKSEKVDLNIISQGVGQISESDVQLAATSNAQIIGFHTSIETHAEQFIKEMGVKVALYDVIYHAVDYAKEEMQKLLDKIAQEVERGVAEVKATFKSSHLGIIAGCIVIDGSIARNSHIRVRRGKDVVWTGPVASLKRVKEDVKEVQKGIECGILLSGYSQVQVGDLLEAYDITYIEQDL